MRMVDNAKPIIMVVDNAQIEYRWGEIEGVGPGSPDFNGSIQPVNLSPGDMAYVMAHGRELVDLSMWGGENLHVASELDIMCTIDMTDLTLKPLGVMIEIEKLEKQITESTVLLPDSKEVPVNAGKVKSVGKGWFDISGNPIEHQVNIGDIVLFDPYKVMVVNLEPLGINEQKFLIMHNDIYGVLNRADVS